ncbi:MAG: hypothetical protein OIF58_14570, partial [Cohaesibacter sp.]|nr:hypothetical protein [Cohaesibacter sp.]
IWARPRHPTHTGRQAKLSCRWYKARLALSLSDLGGANYAQENTLPILEQNLDAALGQLTAR